VVNQHVKKKQMKNELKQDENSKRDEENTELIKVDDTIKWINILPKFVKSYNITRHGGIFNVLTPTEARKYTDTFLFKMKRLIEQNNQILKLEIV